MTIHKITLEWDDDIELLSSGDYQLECTGVKPFSKPDRAGWILTWRPISRPGVQFNDWLTLRTELRQYRWQVERTTQFLTAAGFGEQESSTVTHRDLIGINVWCRVEKFATKKGYWMNRIKKYHKDKPEGVSLNDEF